MYKNRVQPYIFYVMYGFYISEKKHNSELRTQKSQKNTLNVPHYAFTTINSYLKIIILLLLCISQVFQRHGIEHKCILPSSCVSSLIGWVSSPESAETRGSTLQTKDKYLKILYIVLPNCFFLCYIFAKLIFTFIEDRNNTESQV